MTLKPSASITFRPETNDYGVDVTWSGADLDRPCTGGYALRSKKNAERLKRAIDAGAVYTEPKIVRDIYGKSYVQAFCHVMGRYLNADLRRLGF